MSKLTTQVKIKAPKERVWEVLRDFGGAEKYAPDTKRSYYTSETRVGVGASRHMDLQNPSGYLEERVIEWKDGEGYTLEVTKTNAPIKTATGGMWLEPNGEGTIVVATLDYQVKFGPIGTLLDKLIMGRLFRKGVTGYLAGLKYHVETGELVGTKLPKGAREAAAVA